MGRAKFTQILGCGRFFHASSADRGLQALRHREGMGKNWRSYRRGYGRRFIFSAQLKFIRYSTEYYELTWVICGMNPTVTILGICQTADSSSRASLKRRNDSEFGAVSEWEFEPSAMKCPFCGFANDKVVDSRESKEAESIRRRRECLKCGKRFTTYERIDEIPYMVVKKDGRREKFDRQKVLNGLLRACEKRPVPISKLEQIVNEAESFVIESAERERKTSELGELIMNRLRRYDKVAYVRFASVYLDFKDVKEFMNELKDLVKVKTL
jgi:transcriptional repressor NrdR